jgi:MFS family permease
MFWCSQQLRSLPDVADWSPAQKNELVSAAMALVMAASVLGNFLAAALARWLGYRRAIVLLSLGYLAGVLAAYGVPRGHRSLMCWIPAIGACQGVFALFTTYLPPLFPTLLRTTGAGFCYNAGRVAAAAGIVAFGLAFEVDDFRLALCCSGFLILPASAVACYLPEPPAEASATG